MMKVKPLKDIVYLKMENPKAGVLDISSRDSAVEIAEVISVGENIVSLKKGDKVFVKSWGVDIITHNEQRYCFVNIETKAILAVIS